MARQRVRARSTQNMKDRQGPPLVIIIGAMKSGTTTVFGWLSAHPDFSPCKYKEPHFFSDNWNRGLTWYESLFDRRIPAVALGEASQSYTHPDRAESVAERIRLTYPDARLIYLVRRPENRSKSEYRHEVQRGRETREFVDAIADGSRPYLRRSMYFTCLSPFMDRFSRDQILVTTFESVVAEDNASWREILDHIGLSHCSRPVVYSNRTEGKSRFTLLGRKLFGAGLGRFADFTPRVVRRGVKRFLLEDGPEYRALLESAKENFPSGVLDPVWRDIEMMESWLGRKLWTRERT